MHPFFFPHVCARNAQGGLVALSLRSDLYDAWVPAMAALEAAGVWARLPPTAIHASPAEKQQRHPYALRPGNNYKEGGSIGAQPFLGDSGDVHAEQTFTFSVHCFQVKRSFEFMRR